MNKIFFTREHEWLQVDGDSGTVGITDFAQDKLGEVVYAELPEVGLEIDLGEEAGVLESVKAASEFYSPASGVVTEVNAELESSPSLVNESARERGWLFRLRLTDPRDLGLLLDEEEYSKMVNPD